MKVRFLVPTFALAALLAGTLALASASQADTTKAEGQAVTIAQTNAQAISEKRRKLMKAISGARKGLRKKAKAGSIGPAEVAQAEKIAALAKQLTGIWPKGSGSDMVKGRAKPAIWQNEADFNKRLTKMQKAAADGAKAAKAGDAKGVSAAMKAMGCGGCHKRYRGPKPK
ncbi:MAG: cytochrome c [Alphaproteobacteria bacterium]|nr:cytochrome c [Alphaproteobacteria bacterium]